LSVCPRCGIEVTAPTKTWSMVGRPSRTGERFKLTLGLFSCPKCEKRFIEVVGKEKEGTTVKGMVNEIKGIERRLVHTLGDLREKIEKLKLERSELLDEIEELKKAGEEKADTLEKEVASLREEVEALKDMLGDLEE
jgi:predicted  nucleic acid-binding Zn-ribbon protein